MGRLAPPEGCLVEWENNTGAVMSVRLIRRLSNLIDRLEVAHYRRDDQEFNSVLIKLRELLAGAWLHG